MYALTSSHKKKYRIHETGTKRASEREREKEKNNSNN